MNQRAAGIRAALLSALFLGLAPIFGKQAILLGLPWITVVAIRTTLAAGLLMVSILVFQRKYLYIYPAGLLGCFLAGGINGVGSLLYYSALGRIDASLGQMLYALYPLFVALWMHLDRQPLSRLSIVRMIVAVPALFLLTHAGGHGEVDWVGVLMMLGASALYALHLPINQRVLFDMPAPTVTLYTLISMSAVVFPVFLLTGISVGGLATITTAPPIAWQAVLALTLVTFFSRLALFQGVKALGGLQTAILGLSELLVTLFAAQVWLGERFSAQQWIGFVLLVVGLGLVGLEKTPVRRHNPGGLLKWLRPPGLPADFPWPGQD